MSSSLKRKPPKKKTSTYKDNSAKVLIIVGIAAALVGVIAIIASAVGEAASSKTASAASSTVTSGSTAASDAASAAEALSGASAVSGAESVPDTESASGAEATAASAKLATSADDIEATAYADIKIKDYGTVTVALAGNDAPISVANFIKLANKGFYNGLTFHRIIDGFMIQGGDPNGDGSGGSDKTIKGEFSENGVENRLSHVRGAISMARSGDKDSASSQFFIVQSDSTYLNGQYAAFGFVTKGMDIVDRICKDAKPTDSNGTIPADQQPVISSITIREADAASGAESAVTSAEAPAVSSAASASLAG